MEKIKNLMRNNNGLSLMELLISMAILAILAVGFAAIFLPAIKLEGGAVVLNHGTAAMATTLEKVMDEGTATLPTEVVGLTKKITVRFADGTTITGNGVVIQTEDPETGAKLETYVDNRTAP